MTDDLSDRIAAVMHGHLLHRGFHVECACGWVSQEPGRTTVDHDAHVTDVLIRELPELNPEMTRKKYLKDWEEGYDEGYSAGGGGC